MRRSRDFKTKGRVARKDRHGETCQCRRCRARIEALERRSLRLKSSDYKRLVGHIEDYDD